MNEQLRCLDGRLESQLSQVAEIQDVFKRRAEIELNYRYSKGDHTKNIMHTLIVGKSYEEMN